VHVIRVGTVRQRDQLVPKLQLWCHSSQHWLSDLRRDFLRTCLRHTPRTSLNWSPGRHYNADIEQPALDMSLARGGHCPVRIDCYQLLAESGGAMIAPHGT
jgi:hypothetical protein